VKMDTTKTKATPKDGLDPLPSIPESNAHIVKKYISLFQEVNPKLSTPAQFLTSKQTERALAHIGEHTGNFALYRQCTELLFVLFQRNFQGVQASASRPCTSIRFSNFNEGPFGFF
jgi:hypothetical protein